MKKTQSTLIPEAKKLNIRFLNRIHPSSNSTESKDIDFHYRKTTKKNLWLVSSLYCEFI